MMKEGFIIGALLGAVAGVFIYKNNTEAKKAIDKGEKVIKEKMEDYKQGIEKQIKKSTNKKSTAK